MTDNIILQRALVKQALDYINRHAVIDGAPIRDALRAALEKPQAKQEPVAILVGSGHLGGHFDWCTPGGPCLPPGTPFYTHPQPRQPLTDEQITDLWIKHACSGAYIHAFAQAIERAHRIGGDA